MCLTSAPLSLNLRIKAMHSSICSLFFGGIEIKIDKMPIKADKKNRHIFNPIRHVSNIE